jgi:D-glycero-D-manno-heptose 1,7-bisphosphate phosphatase
VSRPAVFLDRDGTLIRDVHYISSPDHVELLPGAADAIRRLNSAGWPVIVVTNQSGIARGRLGLPDYERVQQRFIELLAEEHARVDATYLCPHHPDFTGPCECRKPGTLLFRQAATEHDLDTAASWYLGDRIRDVLPARELGGRGILIPGADTPSTDIEMAREQHELAGSLDEAVRRIVQSAR